MLAGRLDALMAESWPEASLRELSHMFLDLIEHHIERKLTSRAMLEPTL
jgi:hypothetical protein